jgi:hypothetical protein
MAFQGGLLGTLGITPSYLTGLATTTSQSGAILGLGQVWQGAGQSYLASAGQSLVGSLAGSAVNIGLNSLLNTQVVGPEGLSLTSGANILASTITPYVTSSLAAGINQNLQQSLLKAGPFGPVLSQLGAGLINQAAAGITNSISGAANPVENYKMFPGGGDKGEAPADYGGSAYTLNDVVFSLQPANQGPQAFGDEEAVSDPKTATTAATNQVAGNSGTATTGTQATANAAKADKMAQGTAGVSEYDKAILNFMTKGTPKTDKEILALKPEELRALDDILVATKYEGLDPLPVRGYFGSWSFITAPEDVSWDVANNATRVDIFGTNSPPVVAGSRGMRDLTLGNALVEGFVRKVSVEGKVAALEQLLNYKLNGSDGFVSVPVYQVWANSKSYGGSNAYYIIKDVKVKEAMRDLKGNATRAYVDISLMQVPEYQVRSGRDAASQTTAGASSTILISQKEFRALEAAKQNGGQNAQRGVVGQAGQNVKPQTGGSDAPPPKNDVGVVDVRGVKPGVAKVRTDQ